MMEYEPQYLSMYHGEASVEYQLAVEKASCLADQ